MFENKDGSLRLTKPFPEEMSWEKALELSIQKWEFMYNEVLEGRKIRDTNEVGTCALCEKHYSFQTRASCEERCPVAIVTGFDGCIGSPYNSMDYSSTENIQEEIDFLKSLRK